MYCVCSAYVYYCIYTYWRHTCIGRGQRRISGILLCLLLEPLRKDLKELQPARLCSHSDSVARNTGHFQFLTWVLGIWTQVFMLMQQVFLSTELSPKPEEYFCSELKKKTYSAYGNLFSHWLVMVPLAIGINLCSSWTLTTYHKSESAPITDFPFVSWIHLLLTKESLLTSPLSVFLLSSPCHSGPNQVPGMDLFQIKLRRHFLLIIQLLN